MTASGLVPIVVAVTGHRDIPPEDVARLSEVVSAQLHELSSKYPDSPCLLLSGLAEGADRLAARCALDVGWSVGAVLPLSQADYEMDFESDQSVSEFRELLARSIWVRTVSPDMLGRPDCYRKLGEWLARQAQILIALWDGKPGGGPGGTADVVEVFREGLPLDRPILPDAGPVIHILARRMRDLTDHASGAIGTVSNLPAQPAGLPGDGEAARWNDVLERINQFNMCAAKSMATDGNAINSRDNQLLDWSDGSESDANLSAAVARRLYAVANFMSMTAQMERTEMFRGLLALSVLAIFLEKLYSGPFSDPLLIGCAIIASLAGFVWYLKSVRNHVEGRYLDYRALAEACRVQYFWKIAGIRDCASDFYLREQRDELEWIRQAVQTTELGPSSGPENHDAAKLKFVRDAWIDDQLRYFAGHEGKPGGKAAFNRDKDKFWSGLTRGLFLSGVGVTLLTALFHGLFVDPAAETSGWIVQGMILVYGLIFAASGVSKVHHETRAFAENANRYQRMALGYQLARIRIDSVLGAGDLPLARSAIRAIGIEALAENSDWLLLHRERPVTVKVGG